MGILGYFKPFGRMIRLDDDIRNLGKNTPEILKEAIQKGDLQSALALTEYLAVEGKALHDSYTDWVFADLDWISRNYGEEEVPKVLRYAKENQNRSAYWQGRTSLIDARDKVIAASEGQRSHRSGRKEQGDFNIWEETDRYVMEFDPCGSGGRMARGPLDRSGSRLEAPFSLGKTTKPYNWSWNKAGVPYYCIHCCLWSEIMAIEKNGYPLRVTEFPADDYGKPCKWYFYKDPNLIPEAFFERVGFSKDPTRFRDGQPTL